jgi:cardiolipin synthase (CMP-forming)
VKFRVRDMGRVPGLLSLARVPLAALFPFAETPTVAFAILVVAGVTDVLDGWYARRFGQVTPTGAVLDPITDKLFVAVVVATLVLRGRLELLLVPLLGMRELAELPLVLWIVGSTHARRTRTEKASANLPGKLATALQFLSVSFALFGLGAASVRVACMATAVVGAVAAVLYWRTLLAPAARA